MTRILDYSNILNSYILLRENKFDLALKSYTLISNNYLVQFKDFINNSLDYKSGLFLKCNNTYIIKKSLEKEILLCILEENSNKIFLMPQPFTLIELINEHMKKLINIIESI